MIRDVVTVSGYVSLEDATYLMLKNKIGILPVVTIIRSTVLLQIAMFFRLS